MLAAKKLYPKAKLAFPGSQEKGLRDFFLQSTIYVLQTERIKNIDFEKITRLILVDIRQKDRIGRFKEILGKKGLDIHIYDHHPASDNDLVGSVNVIKEVGATTTIFCKIFQERKITITPDEATIMMMGIYEDTGSLTFSSTTEHDFYASAYLLNQGGNLNIVSDIVTKELTAEQVSLLYELIHTASAYNINGTDVVIAKASHEKYVSDFAVLVHKLRDMENIDVLFVLAEMAGRVYLVARSRIKKVNVNKIALEFGGGGHATAASAAIKGSTLPQAEEKLKKILHAKIAPPQTAKNIMSSPVITARADETITEVGEKMSKLQLKTLPVMESSRLVGLINREIIDRAISHKLGNLLIKEYMIADFPVVTPYTSWTKIQKIILQENHKFIPVLKSEKLVGVISRTDILRFFKLDEEKKRGRVYDFDYNLSKVRKKSFQTQMAEQLPKAMLDLMKNLGNMASVMGYLAFAIGGFVRDLLLRYRNYDLDVVIEGDAIKFVRKFVSTYHCNAKYHRKFGTAQIITPEGIKIDVASARREYYEYPAALPVVELSTLRQDLYRRDFTINTLAIRLNPDHFGEMLDFFGGKKDIKNRTVKVIHNLSFVEDPTRIFRALRFEQRFGFSINKETAKMIKNAVKMDIPLRLSEHRIFGELQLILQEENAPAIIKRMSDFDLLKFIHPKLTLDDNMVLLMESINEVLTWFELLFLNETWERWRVYFLGMFDGLSDAQLLDIAERLAFMKKDTKRVLSEYAQAKSVLAKLQTLQTLKNSIVYTMLQPLKIEALLYIMAKSTEKRIRKAVSHYITHLKLTEPILTGGDLKNIGLPPGKIYKQVLDDLLKARLDKKITSREDEITFVETHFLSGEKEPD